MIGYSVLILFAFFRPLTLVLGEYEFYGFNVLEFFPVAILYLSIIIILFNIKYVKVNSMFLAIIFLLFYAGLSYLWGSEYTWIARYIMPFPVLILFTSVLKTENQIKYLLIIFIAGFIYPILGSTYVIISGIGKGKFLYHTGDIRHFGLFLNSHSIGHAMLLFSFIYYLTRFYYCIKNKYINFALDLLFICSIYCLYKAGSRTTFVGFIIFSLIILWKNYKIYFYLFVTVILLIIIFKHDRVSDIIWQTKDVREQSLDSAGSGRLSIWQHNIKTYVDFPIERKLLGAGLGSENSFDLRKKEAIISAHNDYLALLMTLGIFGLFIYIFIYGLIIKDIYYFKFNNRLRTYFIAIMISVLTMNGVSNSYISRVELGQGLFFILSIFYYYKWGIVK
jgi:O-antigen ligase